MAVLFGWRMQCRIRQNRSAARLISALCLVLAAALFFGFPLLGSFDHGLTTRIQDHRSEATQHTVVFVTCIGDFRAPLLAASLLSILPAAARQWRHAAFALAATLATAIANGVL
ncbi:phosphoesterase, partial [Pseudomonas syringae]